MSKRQDNLTFRVLEDMTLRAFNAGSAKSDTIPSLSGVAAILAIRARLSPRLSQRL